MDETGGLAPRPIRRLPASVEPAQAQLAAASALLAGLERDPAPAMRWYRIRPRAVLLGMSQQAEQLDTGACRAAGVTVHRRQSGGGVVVTSDDLLMLDLALPPGDPLFRADLTESYRWLGEAVAAALRALGGAAQVVPIPEARADSRALEPLLARVCFAGRSPYEVLAGGRKVAGLAQVRRRAGALFQLGVYLRWDPWRTAELMAGADRAALAEGLARRVADLDEALGRPPAEPEVVRAVEDALRSAGGLEATPAAWSDYELAARAELAARYAPVG